MANVPEGIFITRPARKSALMSQRLPVLRMQLFVCLVLGGYVGLGAQSTHVDTLVLPQGVFESTFTVAVPLADGQGAELTGSAFAKTIGSGSAQTLGIGETVTVGKSVIGFAGRRTYLFVDVDVAREDTSSALTVTASLDYRFASNALRPRSGPVEPTSSVLAGGKMVKVAVDEDGMYVIDASFLKDAGLSDAGGPKAVRLYTKGGAMLPERVGDDYPVDLREVALIEQGNGDAKWDGGERLLFFGEGEDVWTWNAADLGWDRTENLYAEETYYYVSVGGDGLRARTLSNLPATQYDDTYTYRARWEEDKVNLLRYSAEVQGAGQGSGQPWYGDILNGTPRTDPTCHLGTRRDTSRG